MEFEAVQEMEQEFKEGFEEESFDEEEFLDGLGEAVDDGQEEDENADNSGQVDGQESPEHKIFTLSDGFEISEENLTGILSTFSEIATGKIPSEYLQNVPEWKLLSEIAGEQGKTAMDYLIGIRMSAKTEKVRARAGELVSQYQMNPDEAMKFAEMEDRLSEADRDRQRQAEQMKERYDLEERQRQGWNALINAFPDVQEKYTEYEQFPQEVRNALDDGFSPLEAYQSYLIKEQQRAQKQAALEQKNKLRMVGSATGFASEGEKDSFLAGLEG